MRRGLEPRKGRGVYRSGLNSPGTLKVSNSKTCKDFEQQWPSTKPLQNTSAHISSRRQTSLFPLSHPSPPAADRPQTHPLTRPLTTAGSLSSLTPDRSHRSSPDTHLSPSLSCSAVGNGISYKIKFKLHTLQSQIPDSLHNTVYPQPACLALFSLHKPFLQFTDFIRH